MLCVLVTTRAMEEAFYEASRRMPAQTFAEMRFEDLERDPIGQIRRLYAQLGLSISPLFQQRLERYLRSVAGYQKNRFSTLPEAQQREIDAKMGLFMERWGYRTGDARERFGKRRAA